MTTKTINLQDSFLNQARKENVGGIIHLVSGFKLINCLLRKLSKKVWE